MRSGVFLQLMRIYQPPPLGRDTYQSRFQLNTHGTLLDNTEKWIK